MDRLVRGFQHRIGLSRRREKIPEGELVLLLSNVNLKLSLFKATIRKYFFFQLSAPLLQQSKQAPHKRCCLYTGLRGVI
jgi:hypothetical protein